MYTVYMHVTPSKKVYVGITKQNPVKRWLYGKGYQKQPYFYNAILKYGWNNIEHKILYDGLTKDQAEQKEIELITQYKSYIREYGYNIERGGFVNTVSEETRKKLSEINTGKHHSVETCKKLSELEVQRWKNPEYRANQIAKRKGKTPWNKGRVTPDDVREKQRQAKIGKYIGAKHWNSKKVINLTTGKIYNSFGEIARELNLKNASHIVEVCKGKKPSAYGCKWAYYKGGD